MEFLQTVLLLIISIRLAFVSAEHIQPFASFESQESFTTLNGTVTESLSNKSVWESSTNADPSVSLEPITDLLPTSFESLVRNASLAEMSPGAMDLKRAWFNRHFELASDVLLLWNTIISPIGILGNVMCILVVSQKHNRSVSCSIYMGALAVADTLMLIGNLGQMVIVFPLKFLAFPLFEVLCKIDYYVMFTAAHCGVMIILAMLAERVIAVTKPLQAARLLSPRRAVYIIIGICIFCLTYNIPRALVTSSTASNPAINLGGHCTILTTDLAVGYNFSSFFVTGVIPLFAISIMNAVIRYGVKAATKKIVRQTKYEASSDSTNTSAPAGTSSRENIDENPDMPESKIQDASNGNGQPIAAISKGSTNMQSLKRAASSSKGPRHSQRSRDRQERQLTLMTIVMTTVFLVCTMPRYAHHLTFAAIEARTSLDRYVIYVWSASTTSSLLALNSAVNFYLYVMTGAKFRADVMRLFRCKRG